MHVIITISTDSTNPDRVDVFHDGQFFQKVELPSNRQTPDDEYFEEDVELGDDDMPDFYGPVPDILLPKGFFALAAYRRGKFLFILVGGPKYLEKFGNATLAARVVAKVAASMEESEKEEFARRASSQAKFGG